MKFAAQTLAVLHNDARGEEHKGQSLLVVVVRRNTGDAHLNQSERVVSDNSTPSQTLVRKLSRKAREQRNFSGDKTRYVSANRPETSMAPHGQG